MRIPDQVRKSVVFLGAMEDGRFVPKATGFLVLAYPSAKDTPRPLPNWPQFNKPLPWSPIGFPFLVTAEHVVVGLQTAGIEIYCRMNLRNGGVAIDSLTSAKWMFHPDSTHLTDVAATPFWINTDVADQLYVPFPSATDEYSRKIGPLTSPVAVGADVFVVGLFKNHHGKERNIPIIRIGNVAALPEESVRTSYAGDIEAYLIELRSIAGLSGSPVFIHPHWEGGYSYGHETVFEKFIFLGLIHGHFDITELRYDSIVNDASSLFGSINTGIGVVIPSRLILETLHQPDSVTEMQTQLHRYQKGDAVPDIGVIVLPTDTYGLPLYCGTGFER